MHAGLKHVKTLWNTFGHHKVLIGFQRATGVTVTDDAHNFNAHQNNPQLSFWVWAHTLTTVFITSWYTMPCCDFMKNVIMPENVMKIAPNLIEKVIKARDVSSLQCSSQRLSDLEFKILFHHPLNETWMLLDWKWTWYYIICQTYYQFWKKLLFIFFILWHFGLSASFIAFWRIITFSGKSLHDWVLWATWSHLLFRHFLFLSYTAWSTSPARWLPDNRWQSWRVELKGALISMFIWPIGRKAMWDGRQGAYSDEQIDHYHPIFQFPPTCSTLLCFVFMAHNFIVRSHQYCFQG